MESSLFLNTILLQTWRTGPAYRWSRATAPTCRTTSPPSPTYSATPPASRWTPSSTPSSKTIYPTAMVLANPRDRFSAAVNKTKKNVKYLLKSYLQKNDVLSVLSIIMLSIQLEIVKILTLSMSESHLIILYKIWTNSMATRFSATEIFRCI
jgi:hypothetical protein